MTRGLQAVTNSYKGLPGITRGDKRLQAVRTSYKGLQRVSRDFRG